MSSAANRDLEPVRKSVVVQADAARAFELFTSGFDSWWPRTHHIGKSPMTRAVLQGHVGGRCYSEQEDGTECDWGQVTEWDPPRRLVFAWKISAEWKYEPDNSKCSEVEVRFTPEAGGGTRVDLVHRGFERMVNGADMREKVGAPGGWGGVLQVYAERVAKEEDQ
ncbi:MAG TPA: SRPBCC family protein [Dongiaceae bacterium]|nr:SRPBCC family protein [Dongiaceae bacterium]